MARYLRCWPRELFFKKSKEVVGVGQQQVIRDAARVKRSVAVTLMAYLVLLRVRANEIYPDQLWSVRALNITSPGRSAPSNKLTESRNRVWRHNHMNQAVKFE